MYDKYSAIDKIIDPITEMLDEFAEEHLPTADDVAHIALDGLKESVHLGYMRDHSARAIYAHYFPDYNYGE